MQCLPSLDDVEAKRQQGQQGNDASVLHSLDLALRKRTAALIAGSASASGSSEKAALGKRCSDARKQCLADCRRRLSVLGVCALQLEDMDAFLWQHIAALDECRNTYP